MEKGEGIRRKGRKWQLQTITHLFCRTNRIHTWFLRWGWTITHFSKRNKAWRTAWWSIIRSSAATTALLWYPCWTNTNTLCLENSKQTTTLSVLIIYNYAKQQNTYYSCSYWTKILIAHVNGGLLRKEREQWHSVSFWEC